MPRPTSRKVLALAIALVLGASAFAGIRAGLVAYSPAHLAILRFVTASIFLVIYASIAECQWHFDVLAIYYESKVSQPSFELFQNAFSVSYNH